MQSVNISVKFTLNNIFIVIINLATGQIIQTQTLGKLGFSNRQKRLFETFNLIVAKTFDYISSHRLSINQVKLNQINPAKVRSIKKQFQNICINEVIIIQSVKHNGCRNKKLSRRRNRGLKLGRFKL
jgi:ribosomal protein S11